MRAMVLEKIGSPLQLREVPLPTLGPVDILLKVKACGVCRTDLHIAEGELKHPQTKLPIILGHQVVGTVTALGKEATKWKIGQEVGLPWLGGCCGQCEFCVQGRENLCDQGVYTGFLRDGGYAEYVAASEEFLLPLPSGYDPIHMAPLLCAGLIGYRGFKMVSEGRSLGFYGFGSAAHLLTQIAVALGKEVYVFTRPGEIDKQEFAKTLGAVWAGDSDVLPPKLLDGALLFAPTGSLYPQALQAIKKGGQVISLGIHMSDIPSFAYALLFGEKVVSCVSHLTRQDGLDFMKILQSIRVQAEVTVFPLERANEALDLLKQGEIKGSIVLRI